MSTVASPLPNIGVHRILVCRITHSLGNTLLLTPLIRELESIYPGAEVDVLTRSGLAETLFGAFPSVRHVYRLPKRGVRHPLAFIGTLRQMRRGRYDLVIDPVPRSQTGRTLMSRPPTSITQMLQRALIVRPAGAHLDPQIEHDA